MYRLLCLVILVGTLASCDIEMGGDSVNYNGGGTVAPAPEKECETDDDCKEGQRCTSISVCEAL